jgi:hypothetical protein
MQLVAYGAAVVAAAFTPAWACEAAEVHVAYGMVVAVVAFVAILTAYIVEVHIALIGQAEYVTANLTGATRLLLVSPVRLPALWPACRTAGRPTSVGRLELPKPHRSSSPSSPWPPCGRCGAWWEAGWRSSTPWC